MSGFLGDAQVSQFHDVFHAIDTNKNGTISKKELGNALRSLGYIVTKGYLREFVEAADLDGDGSVNFDEFLFLMARLDLIATRLNDDQIEVFREVFQEFDKNGDGAISKSELGDVMKSLGEKHSDISLQILIQDGDINGDGKLDFQEFLYTIASAIHP